MNYKGERKNKQKILSFHLVQKQTQPNWQSNVPGRNIDCHSCASMCVLFEYKGNQFFSSVKSQNVMSK